MPLVPPVTSTYFPWKSNMSYIMREAMFEKRKSPARSADLPAAAELHELFVAQGRHGLNPHGA